MRNCVYITAYELANTKTATDLPAPEKQLDAGPMMTANLTGPELVNYVDTGAVKAVALEEYLAVIAPEGTSCAEVEVKYLTGEMVPFAVSEMPFPDKVLDEMAKGKRVFYSEDLPLFRLAGEMRYDRSQTHTMPGYGYIDVRNTSGVIVAQFLLLRTNWTVPSVIAISAELPVHMKLGIFYLKGQATGYTKQWLVVQMPQPAVAMKGEANEPGWPQSIGPAWAVPLMPRTEQPVFLHCEVPRIRSPRQRLAPSAAGRPIPCGEFSLFWESISDYPMDPLPICGGALE
jgi:hypothetical protein